MCQCLTLKSLPFYLDGKAVCKHYFSICISQVENARISDIKVKYKKLALLIISLLLVSQLCSHLTIRGEED